MLTQFLKRFDRSMNNRRLECSNLRCEDEICEGMNEFQIVQWREEGWRASHYGMITITCDQCKNNFCHGCFESCNIDICRCCDKF